MDPIVEKALQAIRDEMSATYGIQDRIRDGIIEKHGVGLCLSSELNVAVNNACNYVAKLIDLEIERSRL
jgi:hypothetical protein